MKPHLAFLGDIITSPSLYFFFSFQFHFFFIELIKSFDEWQPSFKFEEDLNIFLDSPPPKIVSIEFQIFLLLSIFCWVETIIQFKKDLTKMKDWLMVKTVPLLQFWRITITLAIRKSTGRWQDMWNNCCSWDKESSALLKPWKLWGPSLLV